MNSESFRSDLVLGLQLVRRDLEIAASGLNLTELHVNAGLLLADIVDALQLSDCERKAALGESLIAATDDLLDQVVGVRLT